MYNRIKHLIKELHWYLYSTDLKSIFAYTLYKTKIPIKIYKNNRKQDYKIIIIGCGTHAISTIIQIILKKHSIQKIFIKNLKKYHLIKKIYNIEITDNLEIYKDLSGQKYSFKSTKHIEYLKHFIKLNIHIFIEKPLVTNKQQLSELTQLYEHYNFSKVLVGYNRDYSPAFNHVKKILNEKFKYSEITYRVNFGKKNKEKKNELENVCHYLSL